VTGAALVVRSRRVVTPAGVRPARIVVRDGRIVAVEPHGPGRADRRPAEPRLPEHDFGDRVILPGLVDTHVHVNEPGRTHWEGFASGTRAAVLGGITTLVDMPLNSDPPTTTVEALERKREAAAGTAVVDVGAWAGLVPESVDRIEALAGAGALGFKAFLVDSGIPEFPPVDEPVLRAAMPAIAALGLPLLVHAESPGPIAGAAASVAGADPRRHAVWEASRPVAAEVEAIDLLARLAGDTGCRVHVVHVSSAAGADRLARARAEGAPLGGETCPHYLIWCGAEIEEGATVFKCAPPIRGSDDREALWRALETGVLDLVASDHSPTPPDLKRLDTGDFFGAWGGIASLGLALPALWAAASARGIPIERLARWLSSAPAALAGLAEKGEIRTGGDADLVVFDPEPERVLAAADLRFRHAVSPYVGARVRGRVEAVFLRGALRVSGAAPVEGERGRWIEKGGRVA